MHQQYKQGYLEALLAVQLKIGKHMAWLEAAHLNLPANWFGGPRRQHHEIVAKVRLLKELSDEILVKSREMAKESV